MNSESATFVQTQGSDAAAATKPGAELCLASGWLLIGLFAAQWAFDWSWPALQHLQEDEIYRQVTGAFLALGLFFQWRFAWLRRSAVGRDRALLKNQHRWQGVIAIPLVYLHSISLGYAYQLWLALSFLANIAWGLLSPDAINVRARRYVFFWLVVHVSMATACTLLLLYHINIVYTFH